jgi:hypothetical protein
VPPSDSPKRAERSLEHGVREPPVVVLRRSQPRRPLGPAAVCVCVCVRERERESERERLERGEGGGGERERLRERERNSSQQSRRSRFAGRAHKLGKDLEALAQ